MKRLYIIAIAAFSMIVMTAKPVQAQEGNTMGILNYSMSVPVGDITDYVNDFSWRGFNLDVRYFVSDFVSFGVVSGWNVYNSSSEGNISEVFTINDAQVTITGKQYRFLNVVPILATAYYYLEAEGMVRPYIGAGIGGYYVESNTEMGLYSVTDSHFQFGLAPAIGVLIPAGYSHINMGLTYNQAFGTSNAEGVGTLNFNFGIAWGLD